MESVKRRTSRSQQDQSPQGQEDTQSAEQNEELQKEEQENGGTQDDVKGSG